MGSYLSTPSKEKFPEDSSNDRLIYGANCMQGWRVSQEDAHNCILDFDDGVSLFAVYDGHGGPEVALYCSQHLPDCIKKSSEYASKAYKDALISSFLRFDSKLLNEEVKKELDTLSKSVKKEDDQPKERRNTLRNVIAIYNNATGENLYESVQILHKEAKMPIGRVMERLSGISEDDSDCDEEEQASSLTETETNEEDATDKPNTSRYGRCRRNSRSEVKGAKCSKDEEVVEDVVPCGTSKIIVNGNSSNGQLSMSDCDNSEKDKDNNCDNNTKKPLSKKNKGKATLGPAAAILSSLSSKLTNITKELLPEKEAEAVYDVFKSSDTLLDDSESDDETFEISTNRLSEVNNDDDSEESEEETDESSSEEFNDETENSEEEEEEEDEDGDEDESANENEENDNDVSEDKQNNSLPKDSDKTKEIESDAVNPEQNEKEEDNLTAEEGAANDDEEADDEETEDDIDDDDDEHIMLENIFAAGEYSPGVNSGCTAVVALITDDCVYVANAGDSRCVASQSGTALDLSIDHKPEDEAERIRINAAGGSIRDGRVNNGLNLSRAIGDHHYKNNKSLPDTEQMITALPDVMTCKITSDLEFIVLACDGIWNSMTSQEVVDFVHSRIAKKKQLSKICEELFDNCLAPDTLGDGTGCDNMTCIIVQFTVPLKKAVKKNLDSVNESSSPVSAKRLKANEIITDNDEKSSSTVDNVDV